MDKLDDILNRYYKKLKGELIQAQKGCPQEDLLWKYARGELREKEREEMDGHLLACSGCLESLKVIRMILQAQGSALEVPAHLHEKAMEILQEALGPKGVRPKEGKIILRLSLQWDHLKNRITQLVSDVGGMLVSPAPEFQPVRKAREGESTTFPYKRSIPLDDGTLMLEIDRSGKGKTLSLAVTLQGRSKDRVSDFRAILYKSDRIRSSLYLSEQGTALFSNITEGDYSLELCVRGGSLGMIEISLSKVQQ
ncbi:MAG: anti-sigma factor family protein [bacterium]